MTATSRFFPYHLVLPNMPGVAMELLRGMRDDRLSLEGLAELIGKDPALAAKVLRIANSARYSPLRSIGNLRDAAATLGMTLLRNLTMASSLSGSFPAIPGLDRQRFWRHGIATAHYATQLAKLSLLDADAAYLAGLMLRIGQLLMGQIDKLGVAEVEKQVIAPGARFALERQRWGCTHSDVTAELARRWQFPDNLVTALDTAAEPLAAQPFSPLGAVLHLAEVLADALDLDQPPLEVLERSQPELVARLRLKTHWLADKLVSADDLAQEALLMTGA